MPTTTATRPLASQSSVLQEIRQRLDCGQVQITLKQLEQMIEAIGYRLDRRFDCKSMATIMSGPRAGTRLPTLSVKPVQMDDGKAFSHYEARRDRRFDQLIQIRRTYFAVVDGHLAEF
jgi:hypothetical protein